MYARRPEGCLRALPFVCRRQEISFSNGVKKQKTLHRALKAPVLGGDTSPPLTPQTTVLRLGWLTLTQAASLTSCSGAAEKNELLRGLSDATEKAGSPSYAPGSRRCTHSSAQKLFKSYGLAAQGQLTQEREEASAGRFRGAKTQGGSHRCQPRPQCPAESRRTGQLEGQGQHEYAPNNSAKEIPAQRGSRSDFHWELMSFCRAKHRSQFRKALTWF